MNHFSVVIRIWSVSLVACAAIVASSFLRMDVPTALYFWNVGHLRSLLNVAFGSTVILSAESTVILFTVLARFNDDVLKVFFGVPNPADVVHGAGHSFNFWMGSDNSSFPSGHMVLAGAFAGVFMRLHKASIRLFSALLLIAAGLLLVGDWRFLSDIIAGAFLGTSAGILAGEGWAAHSAR